ncbi:alpha/beta fold hydrolase [Rubneribacter sp.]
MTAADGAPRLALPAPAKGRFDHEGVRYRYLMWPARAKAVAAPFVLLHGFAQSAASWDRVAPLLAKDRVVYALDLVGHGGSEAPENPLPYALDLQGEALLAFVRFVGGQAPGEGAAAGDAAPHDPAGSGTARAREKAPRNQSAATRPVVVGYSMGGRVALSAAVRRRDDFAACASALVLEGAGLGPATEAAREQDAARDAKRAARLREVGVEAFMDEWERLPLFATQRALPCVVREHIRAGRLANDAEALARTFEHAGQHAMPARDQVLAALSALRLAGVFVLYLAGERDRKYRALADELADGGLCETRTVKGVGHNAHVEDPVEFARVLGSVGAR